MDYKKFFKPTVWTWIFFVIFIIAAYYILTNVNLRIIPCETSPVVPNPPAPKPAMCLFASSFLPGIHLSGLRVIITPTGYIIGYFVLLINIIIPYILASLINYFIKGRN